MNNFTRFLYYSCTYCFNLHYSIGFSKYSVFSQFVRLQVNKLNIILALLTWKEWLFILSKPNLFFASLIQFAIVLAFYGHLQLLLDKLYLSSSQKMNAEIVVQQLDELIVLLFFLAYSN